MIQSTTLDAVEGVLEKSELSSDQRVLKLALKLIFTLFHNFANADSVDIVSKVKETPVLVIQFLIRITEFRQCKSCYGCLMRRSWVVEAQHSFWKRFRNLWLMTS